MLTPGSVLALTTGSRANTKSSLDFRHKRNMRGASHLVEFMLRVLASFSSGMRVGESSLVASSDAISVFTVEATMMVCSGVGSGRVLTMTSKSKHYAEVVVGKRGF
jgi:hypothetical protein